MSRMAAKWYSLPLFKLGFLFYVCWIQLLGIFGLVLKSFHLHIVIDGKIERGFALCTRTLSSLSDCKLQYTCE